MYLHTYMYIYIYVYINTATLPSLPYPPYPALPKKREHPRKSFNYMLVVGLGGAVIGTQFTCFTGTEVQMLMLGAAWCRSAPLGGTQFTCFTVCVSRTSSRLLRALFIFLFHK